MVKSSLLTMFFFVYSLNQDKRYMTSIVTLVLSIVVLVELIYYLHGYQRTIAEFLSSIKTLDFSTVYTKSDFK